MARGRKRKIELGLAELISYFDSQKTRAFSLSVVQGMLEDLRPVVGVAMTAARLIAFLEENAFLRTLSINRSTHPGRPIIRYVWRDASPADIALSLAPKGYLCHGTAVMLHGLTDALPKIMYVNREQSPKPSSDRDELVQGNINRAFASKQRETNYICSWEGAQCALLSGKYTARLEVGNVDFAGVRLAVTKIERTLIDIAVRPTYSGGVYQVLEAYRRAMGRISIGTMLATLKTLDYTYPYHQAIGFYLQRAGFSVNEYSRFKTLGFDYDFFLAHDLREREFVEEWRLYIPKGF